MPRWFGEEKLKIIALGSFSHHLNYLNQLAFPVVYVVRMGRHGICHRHHRHACVKLYWLGKMFG